MVKPKIIVVGCGEHARMVVDNIEEQDVYEVLGYSTNASSEVGLRIYGYTVLCCDTELPTVLLEEKELTGYILGVGNLKTRAQLYPWLDGLLPPINVIHPSAIVSRHATVGRGNVFEAYTKIANGATILDHCIVNSFTAVNHDQFIERNVLIAGNVSMAGKRIGENTVVADGASIGFKRSVGRQCIIGDGAVVTKDIPDFSVAYGNPARVIRQNVW